MASNFGRCAGRRHQLIFSAILRTKATRGPKLCQKRPFSDTRNVRQSNPACEHDEDFFGLKENLGKSYSSDHEAHNRPTFEESGVSLKYENTLKTVDPKSYEPKPTKSDFTIKNVSYGFVRYDSGYRDDEKQNVEKLSRKVRRSDRQHNTDNVKDDETISQQAESNMNKTDGYEDNGNTNENTGYHVNLERGVLGREYEQDISVFDRTDTESVKSDLNFIDEQFFHHDSQASIITTQQSEPVVGDSAKCNIDKTELSFIDGQYFEHESKSMDKDDDMSQRNNSKARQRTKLSMDEETYRRSENDSFDKNLREDLNFVDEQYFSQTSHTETMNQIVSSADQNKVDKIKEFRSANDESTDFTDKIFNSAKDFRQVKPVIEKYRKRIENAKSYEGKAYSVIKDLRESNSPGVASFGKPRYTFDSQGFRILKHQVPQFEFASSLDIVHLLRKSIIYNENELIAINKPYGLESHGGPGVRCSIGHLLNDILPSTKLHLVHRLDKETTGLMLLAKSADMAHQLQQLFYKREVKKRYLVISKGHPSSPKGLIDIPITEGQVGTKYRMTLRPYKSPELNPLIKSTQEGKEAKTLYRVLDSNNMTSLIECIGLTGLKHQIRVHLAFGLNCPILGDHKYAHMNKIAPMQLHPITLDRLKVQQSKVRYIPMHLHARSVMIQDFLKGKHLFISAPLPNHFVDNMRTLKLKLPPRF